MKWWRGALGLDSDERAPAETKAFAAISFPGLAPGRQDGDNFRRNTITLESANDGGAGVERGAAGLTTTWACVSFWAGNIASLPVAVQQAGPGDVPVENGRHPLHWLLHDSPNADQSAFEFMEFMVASLELRGNAFAEIVRGAGERIVALVPIAPDSVRVRRLGGGELAYKWRDATGERDETQSKVLHIRGFGGGPLGGVSPLTVCRAAFGSALAVDQAASAMFANGIRPSGVLSPDKVLTPEQMAEAQQLIEEKHVGAMRTGRPLLLNAGLTWTALTIDPQDAQMLESRRFSVEEVCRVFELDPHLVGQTQGNTTLGSSIAEQTLAVLKFKMRKRLKRIEGALEKQLLTPAERASGVTIKFNVEAFLRADSAARAEYYNNMERYYTVNEIRALEGKGPVPGGDVLYRQMQDVPLTAPMQQPAGV